MPTGSEASAEEPALAGSRSLCSAYQPTILAKLEQGLTAQRIYQDLCEEQGFTGKYSSVRRFVQRLQQRRPLPFRRLEVEPGYEMQVDYGSGARCLDAEGKLRRTHVFRLVLSYSRKGYSEAVWRLTTESFIRSLENAFWALGGVPKVVVFDNAPSVVQDASWYDPELHPKIVEFCRHYHFTLLPTRPRTPRHKGKIRARHRLRQRQRTQGTHLCQSVRAKRAPGPMGTQRRRHADSRHHQAARGTAV